MKPVGEIWEHQWDYEKCLHIWQILYSTSKHQIFDRKGQIDVKEKDSTGTKIKLGSQCKKIMVCFGRVYLNSYDSLKHFSSFKHRGVIILRVETTCKREISES